MSKCSFAALRSRTGSHSLKGFVLGPRLQSKSERAVLWTNTDGHLKVEKHYRRQTSPRETSGTLKSIFPEEASQLKPRKKERMVVSSPWQFDWVMGCRDVHSDNV